VDSVDFLRPMHADPRVQSVIVRSLASSRYTPATACGHPVPFTLTISFLHCPTPE
jgi:hypothetical protein